MHLGLNSLQNGGINSLLGARFQFLCSLWRIIELHIFLAADFEIAIRIFATKLPILYDFVA